MDMGNKSNVERKKKHLELNILKKVFCKTRNETHYSTTKSNRLKKKKIIIMYCKALQWVPHS